MFYLRCHLSGVARAARTISGVCIALIAFALDATAGWPRIFLFSGGRFGGPGNYWLLPGLRLLKEK